MSQAMNRSTRRIHSLDDCEPFTMQLHPAVSRIIKSYRHPRCLTLAGRFSLP